MYIADIYRANPAYESVIGEVWKRYWVRTAAYTAESSTSQVGVWSNTKTLLLRSLILLAISRAPVFLRQILPNSAAQFVKFHEIPWHYYPKYRYQVISLEQHEDPAC